MTWTYDVSGLASSKKDQVRFLLGDTNENDQQLEDEEITFALTNQGQVIYGAASVCCQSLATKFSRRADTTTGELRTLYSSVARAYAARAQEYANQLPEISFEAPYSGGVSIADKVSREIDPDRTEPDFDRGMTDNWTMPVAPSRNHG